MLSCFLRIQLEIKNKNKTAPMLQPLGETKGVFEDSSASFDEMIIHDLH